MKLIYKAQLIDEDTDTVIARISGYSGESFQEELGKLENAGMKYIMEQKEIKIKEGMIEIKEGIKKLNEVAYEDIPDRLNPADDIFDQKNEELR